MTSGSRRSIRTDTERDQRPGRRAHRPRRSQYLADGFAGDRPARASAPRRATVVHRPRRIPLPSDPDRPDRPRHRRPGASSPPTRPRRGPHPRRQGHRPGQAPVQGVRPERGVAGDRDARARPDRLDPSPLPRRRARQGRTETLALPTAAPRRPARVLRTPRQAAPPHGLAVDRGAQGRVREAQHAPRRRPAEHQPPPHTHPPSRPPATGRDHRCPNTHPNTSRRSRGNTPTARHTTRALPTTTSHPPPNPRRAVTPPRLLHDRG